MNPRQLEQSLDPSDLRREEARRRLAALVAAHEELGSSPEEALEAALRQLAAEAAPAKHGDLFPTFRAAARQAPRFRRRARRIFSRLAWGAARGVAGLTCLLLLVTLVANVVTGQALEQELALVRDRGEPLTLREVAPPPVPDAENAALVYEQAFRRLPRTERIPLGAGADAKRLAHEDEAVLSQFVSDEAAKRQQAPIPRVRQALAGTEEALALVRQAAGMPPYCFPVNWEDGGEALFPHYAKLRSFCRLLGADAALAAMDGKPAQALADVRAIVGMTRQLDPEPVMVGRVVQYSWLAVAQESLRRLLETASIDEAESRMLDQSLASVDLYAPFERAVEGERCFGLWAFDVARTDPAKWRALAGNQITSLSLLSTVLRPLGSPLLKMDERFYLRFMARRTALAQQKRRISTAEWAEYDLRYPWYAEVTRLVLPIFALACDRRDEAVARLALSQWGLTLDLCRQRAGHYPDSLAEAERTVGWDLPVDPFNGHALRYRRQGSGYLLYSVGVNGRDDQGLNDGPKATSLPTKQDDIAWRIGV